MNISKKSLGIIVILFLVGTSLAVYGFAQLNDMEKRLTEKNLNTTVTNNIKNAMIITYGNMICSDNSGGLWTKGKIDNLEIRPSYDPAEQGREILGWVLTCLDDNYTERAAIIFRYPPIPDPNSTDNFKEVKI